MNYKLSVIIPTLNEEKYLPKLLNSLSLVKPDEVIIVDGGSADRTIERAKNFGATVIFSEKGRGIQLHQAPKLQKDFLLFLHADTYFIEPLDWNTICQKNIKAGYFEITYEEKVISLKILAQLINLRSEFFKLPYGDQGLLIERELYFQIGGYKAIPFLEDLDLILRLKKVYPPKNLKHKLIVSGRKLIKPYPLYPFFASLRNNIFILLFFLGISPELLKKYYK